MGKLSESLKLILEGLAYQDAADYLSTDEKLEVLGINPRNKPEISVDASGRRSYSGRTGRRIALISSGGSEGPAVDFALSACRRYAAELDLVSLGASPTEEVALRKLRQAAREAGTQVCQMRLPQERPEALRDYISSQPSLIYLVAAMADELACELAERILCKPSTRIPLVLVRSHPPIELSSVYAA